MKRNPFIALWFVFLTLHAPMWAAASNSGAAVANLLNCGNGSTINNLGNGTGTGMTLSIWVYVTNGTGSWFGKDVGNVGWNFFASAVGGTFSIEFYRRTTGTRLQRIGSTLVTTSVLHNLIVTWDGSLTNTNIHLYIDGTEIAYTSGQDGTGTLKDDSTSSMCIFAGCNTTNPYTGTAEDAAAWSRVLVAAEITNVAGSHIAGIPLTIKSGLVGYWPLNDVSFGTALDRSGNGNNCPVTGTVSVVGGRIGLRGA